VGRLSIVIAIVVASTYAISFSVPLGCRHADRLAERKVIGAGIAPTTEV
jgi:hypothetical protein